MNEMIEGIGDRRVAPARPSDQERTARIAPAQPAGGEAARDAIELSDAARNHIDAAGIRRGLVERVRAEIAGDTYVTDEKLEIAADRLLKDLLARRSSA